MKQYIRVYKALLRMNVMTLLAYRGNLINSSIATIVWGVFLFISMFLVTSQVPVAYGFKQIELLLVISGYSIMVGLFHTLFAKNFESFSRRIRYGELDMLLLKPVDSQWLATFSLCNFTSTIRILLGVMSGIYFLSLASFTPTIASIIGSIVLLMTGVAVLYCLWMGVATLLIWFPRAAHIIQLMYSVTGFARFPRAMYQQFGFWFFLLFFPLTLLVFPSIKTLLFQFSLADTLWLVFFFCLFFLLSRFFWLWSLRSYTSASS